MSTVVKSPGVCYLFVIKLTTYLFVIKLTTHFFNSSGARNNRADISLRITMYVCMYVCCHASGM